MINPEVKAKWVAALRSGKYTQTTGSLKNPAGYCCLGVLCEVSGDETGFGIVGNTRDTEDEVIGITIRNWSGLTDPYGNDVTIDDKLGSLASHNDAGKTFNQIADAIEEQL